MWHPHLTVSFLLFCCSSLHPMENTQEREEQLAHLGLSVLRSNSGIVLLGDTGRRRLPIFSFVVRHGKR